MIWLYIISGIVFAIIAFDLGLRSYYVIKNIKKNNRIRNHIHKLPPVKRARYLNFIKMRQKQTAKAYVEYLKQNN